MRSARPPVRTTKSTRVSCTTQAPPKLATARVTICLGPLVLNQASRKKQAKQVTLSKHMCGTFLVTRTHLLDSTWPHSPKEPCLKSKKYIFQTFDGRAWIFATLYQARHIFGGTWHKNEPFIPVVKLHQVETTKQDPTNAQHFTIYLSSSFARILNMIWHSFWSDIPDRRWQSMECGRGNFSLRYCPGIRSITTCAHKFFD